ncbi:MAG: hypothetical protein KAV99_00705 [Candidatus Latescibacteria bacterium]|nr:hypothetical protein [Candidatus Latescibacterota bacterium]
MAINGNELEQAQDSFIQGLKLAVEKTNINAQLSNFNEALKQGLFPFDELVARSFLMRCYATQGDLEEANKEARRAREIYSQLQETFELRDNPGKAMFLHGYRRAPVYPESIRDDWPEEERKKAALEMMREYHEVFIEPRVLHFYLGECYLERGEINLAISESEKVIYDFDEDPPLAVIFHTRLGAMYKEKGDFACAAGECRKAVDAYSEVDDLWFSSDELLAEKFRDGMSFWTDKAKQLLVEIEPQVQKKRCFIATAVYGTPYALEVQILKGFRDEFLLGKVLGRLFVFLYYRVSPPFAFFIEKHTSVQRFVKFVILKRLLWLIRHFLRLKNMVTLRP